MIRLFVRHNVTDYSKWRTEYDGFDSERHAMGVRAACVYHNVDDGNDITAYHDFDSMDAAKSFAGSSQLHEAMERAGVVGEPQVWFVEQAWS